MTIRVVSVDDHPLMLKAIRDELSSDPEIQVVGELNRGSDLAKFLQGEPPDVLVLDLALSDETFKPLTTIRDLTLANPNLRILILSGSDNPLLIRSFIEAGALGYILKDDDLSLQLIRAVKTVYRGKPFYSDQIIYNLLMAPPSNLFTDQEVATLRLVAKGLATNGIAAVLEVSEKRVRNILSKIYSKLKLKGDKTINQRVACIKKARELGLLNDL